MNRWQKILVIVMLMTGPITQAIAGWQSSTTKYYRTGSNPLTDITEQKAIAIAQQNFKGRVLSINHADNIFRIKILNNQGTVHTILINATDGSIISTY